MEDSSEAVSGVAPTELLQIRPRPPTGAAVVTIANQKGGVAKTTTAVNLAAALALRGHRVLLVDLDAQGNATTGVGLARGVTPSVYDVLAGTTTAAAAAHPTRVPGLRCIPASVDLAGAELELAGAERREHVLGGVLAPLRPEFDMIVIDCPPSLGLLTVNALAASDDVLVPVQAEYYALEGLGRLLETADRIRRSVNPRLRIAGMLLTMFDGRTRLAGDVAAEVRRHFGDIVFETVIPRSVRLSEAPSFGEPVVTLDPGARGSIAYRQLAAEVERRYGLPLHVPAPPGAVPGPHGRGFGTVAPEPPGLDEAWPPKIAWGA